ncbi:mitochondrial 37S ribosomal protein [Martiniozyma asiatica (nom. inval.)]|nr:mitochondrial 37S ribosomal protein [Martiniozyma asiatica]
MFSRVFRRGAATGSRKFRAAQKKKQNIAKQQAVSEAKEQVDPVLGRPNTPFFHRLQLELQEPNQLSHGYKIEQVDTLLFGAKKAALNNLEKSKLEGNENVYKAQVAQLTKDEALKREAILRILAMRNADNEQMQKKLTELAVQEFQRFDGDTGSSEAQAAAITVRIQNLMTHVKANPQDLAHQRRVRMLTQKRQRLLRYLKRDNPQRYFWAIEKLGLTDENVHMEFNFDKKYMDEFQVWPGRKMAKVTKKEAELELKARRAVKKAQKSAKLSNEQDSLDAQGSTLTQPQL